MHTHLVRNAENMNGNVKAGNQIFVFRNEVKYYISYLDYFKIRQILSNFLKADANAASTRGYWIRSLYFDTPDNREYVEKIVGVEKRKKIRLRIYDTNDRKIKLEIKNKYNTYMKKETTYLDREQAMRLVHGDKSFLLESRNTILNRVYYLMSKEYYMPVVIVDYYRDAFIENFNNIRITFDRDISACATDFDIFSTNLHLFPVFDCMTIVMEVKYNHFLPAWLKRVLSCIKTVNSAISKYCYSRETCLTNL
jgi:hypothetical protein